MNYDDMIAVLQAAKAGKTIQGKVKHLRDADWGSCEHCLWDFSSNDYRAKPEPREWWFNDYGTDPARTSVLHTSKEAADKDAGLHRQRCVHVREIFD